MMLVELTVIVAFLIVFGVFIVCVSVAMATGQRYNRKEVQRLAEEFDRIVDKLGEEEGEEGKS